MYCMPGLAAYWSKDCSNELVGATEAMDSCGVAYGLL